MTNEEAAMSGERQPSVGEEFIDGIFTPPCRGCAGGFGLADNAHTRDERCQFRSDQPGRGAVVLPSCTCGEEFGYHDCVVHVGCDRECKALTDPQTAQEWKQTAIHYRDHSYLSGCSHGC